MRAGLIAVGVELLERLHWAIYPLAALLAYAAYRMLRGEERQTQLVEKGCALCTSWLARVMPIHPRLEGARFLVRKEGRWMATPMLVALAVIETTDLVFAVDSIPAVFAVTRDPFLVYTSNIFALLGLRSLYFLLAGVIRKLRFLRIGLAVMLLLAAAKLALGSVVHVPPLVSLAAIVVDLFSLAIGASLALSGDGEAPAPAGEGLHPPRPDRRCRAEHRRLRGMPKDGRAGGCTAHVPQVRPRRLLRQLEESARYGALPRRPGIR